MFNYAPEAIESFVKVDDDICKYSFLLFILKYLPHKFKFAPADYHKEIIQNLQNLNGMLCIVGYRGSAKTTLIEAYALWLFLYQHSKFILIISNNKGGVASNIIANIKNEIESNVKITKDFGLKQQENNNNRIITKKWSASHLELNGSHIVVRNKGTPARGLLLNGNRPDTILVDDMQDRQNVKKKENRRKDADWFVSEVLGGLTVDVEQRLRIVLIGNYVHQDCLIANILKNKDNHAHLKVIEMWISMFIDNIEDEEHIRWKGRFPNMEAVGLAKDIIFAENPANGNVVWQREMNLKIIAEDEQIIKAEDIQYYDTIPQSEIDRGNVVYGLDLAITENESSDYTAAVGVLRTRNNEGKIRLYVSKNIINTRMGYNKTIEKLIEIHKTNLGFKMVDGKWIRYKNGFPVLFGVEQNGYQRAVVESLVSQGVNAIGINTVKDKAARLALVSQWVKNGTVLFPRTSQDVRDNNLNTLIEQLVGFGVESHDDLVDAFIHAVNTSLYN